MSKSLKILLIPLLVLGFMSSVGAGDDLGKGLDQQILSAHPQQGDGHPLAVAGAGEQQCACGVPAPAVLEEG